jgi:predicted amidohydrolase YtcJ
MTIADLILYNGRCHACDSRFDRATALAICGNQILCLGTDKDICAMAGPDTRSIDLDGKLVLPGFWDTHFHFFNWAENLNAIELQHAQNFSEMETMVRDRAGLTKKGEWITGQGFNEAEWPENRMPDRADLDRLAPDHPVCLWRTDCHLAVANSRALALAGIHKDFSFPEGAVVVRDAAGHPTGVLKELAPNLISAVLPELSEDRLLDNMETAMGQLHGLGLTGIHDVRLMGGKDGARALQAWQALNRSDRLRLRTFVSLPGETLDQACDMGLTTGFGDDFLRIGWVKYFADGGMGARTGWMTQPYLDGGKGMALTPVDQIARGVEKADQAGLSCMVHAIGDRACKEMISVFETVQSRGNTRCHLPHRLEHIQMILPEDLKRLAALTNLATSCQPSNMSLDISMIDECAGERGKLAYAFKPIAATGLPLMLNSDAPVADPNPFAGIYSAVTRKRMDRTPANGWYPEHRLTVEEAVKAYTLTPAQVSGRQAELGSLTPGKRADMVVVDRDIFSIDPDELADTRVAYTLFNGQIVYGD